MAKVRLLLVDDEPELIESYAEFLEGQGFECKLTTDGKAAQKLLDEETFDLVISDLCMEPVTGLELAVSYTHLTLPTRS